MFADRGKEEVVVPEGALNWRQASFCLHLAEIKIMKTSTIRREIMSLHMEKYERAVRLLFVEAALQGKYDELVADFTKRLLLR